MKPLNQNERNNLYLKFSLLFILHPGITVFALFFDYQLPGKLREDQITKLKYFNSFIGGQKKIIKLMDTLNRQTMNFTTSNRGLSIEKDYILQQISFLKIKLQIQLKAP